MSTAPNIQISYDSAIAQANIIGPFATTTDSIALVGTSAPYVQYLSDGTVWNQLVALTDSKSNT